MSLEQEINEGIKSAMKNKQEAELRSLRAIKAAILLVKTSGNYKGELSKDEEIKMLQKLVKQRNDSLEIFRQQHRDDLASKEEEEIHFISQYLPQPLTEEELRSQLQKIIAETGASSPADMGKVMGVATKQLAGKADGKAISGLVKELLAK